MKSDKKRRRRRVFDSESDPKKVNPPAYDFLKKPSGSQKGKSPATRLNKYIAHAGICSRREADKLIERGEIKVNNKVITELGYQVKPQDKVYYKGRLVKKEKFIYVLLNKPKDLITTTDDPQDRSTVMDLVVKHIDERIYPVGRLDRNTTGLLLLTNDGDLAQRLSHPSYNIRKVYEVQVGKPVLEDDVIKIGKGVELEDGVVKADDIAIISPDNKTLGLEIHSGKNRVVRRIFESLGYEVTKLDRVMYAFLTKKNLPRGKWRFLLEHEVIKLKHLGRGRKKPG